MESFTSFSDPPPRHPTPPLDTHTYFQLRPAALSPHPQHGRLSQETRLHRGHTDSPSPAASKRPGLCLKFRVHRPTKSAHLFLDLAALGSTFGSSEGPCSRLQNSQVLSNAIKRNVNNFAALTTGVRVTQDVARILSPPGSSSAKFEDQQRGCEQRKWTYLQTMKAGPPSQPSPVCPQEDVAGIASLTTRVSWLPDPG